MSGIRNPGVPRQSVRLVEMLAELAAHGRVTRTWARQRWPQISLPTLTRDMHVLWSTLAPGPLPCARIQGCIELTRASPVITRPCEAGTETSTRDRTPAHGDHT